MKNFIAGFAATILICGCAIPQKATKPTAAPAAASFPQAPSAQVLGPFGSESAQVPGPLGPEVTVTGTGSCAKCALQVQGECQNAIQFKEAGQPRIYFLTGDKSKAFHDTLCKAKVPITVTGVVYYSDKNAREELAVTKIERAQ